MRRAWFTLLVVPWMLTIDASLVEHPADANALSSVPAMSVEFEVDRCREAWADCSVREARTTCCKEFCRKWNGGGTAQDANKAFRSCLRRQSCSEDQSSTLKPGACAKTCR